MAAVSCTATAVVQPSWGTLSGPGWTLVFSALPLLSSQRHCRFSTSALPYSTFTKPPSCLPHSHISTLPSGTSKYFPSLLFEASMGHGTSCTNHAGPAEGGRGGRERTGMSKKHRNSICTVFLRGCFSSPRQPSLISCFQTASLRSSRCGWRPWQLILTIFPSCTTGKREGE